MFPLFSSPSSMLHATNSTQQIAQQQIDTKNTSRYYGPFGPSVKCMNNLESKYLGEKLARHRSLESLECSKCEAPVTPKPRKKEIELSDHIQFLITEKSPPQACIIDVRETVDDGDVLSEGKFAVANFFF